MSLSESKCANAHSLCLARLEDLEVLVCGPAVVPARQSARAAGSANFQSRPQLYSEGTES